eukprot:sb/3470278/
MSQCGSNVTLIIYLAVQLPKIVEGLSRVSFDPTHHLQFCRNFIDLKRKGIDKNSTCDNYKENCCAYWTSSPHENTIREGPTHADHLVPYCCMDYEDCCYGNCCKGDSEICCIPDAINLPGKCCSNNSECCLNTRGETVCCPMAVRQIWILIGVFLSAYFVLKVVRAIQTYCNITPFEEENFVLLPEYRVHELKYCFCGIKQPQPCCGA